MKQNIKFIIDSNYDSTTVKDYLIRNKKISNTCLKVLKHSDDGIMLNGVRVFVNAKLQTGDLLEINISDDAKTSIVPVEGNLSILFEDEDLLVVDKPPYMPVHPSRGHEFDSLANIVLDYYARCGLNTSFRCVTRLDKNTSGIVIIAKNRISHDRIRLQLVAHTVEKHYLALVHGITEPFGTVNAPIARPDNATIKREISNLGAPAITHYITLKNDNNISLVELIPETGRTHQIRVHMAYIGHPLCGDFLYGIEKDGFKRQMLHAYRISLNHPTTNKTIIFESKNDRWIYE